ncbi:hypothetical protein FRC17_008166, partial [Serendipita sp. 399]
MDAGNFEAPLGPLCSTGFHQLRGGSSVVATVTTAIIDALPMGFSPFGGLGQTDSPDGGKGSSSMAAQSKTMSKVSVPSPHDRITLDTRNFRILSSECPMKKRGLAPATEPPSSKGGSGGL